MTPALPQRLSLLGRGGSSNRGPSCNRFIIAIDKREIAYVNQAPVEIGDSAYARELVRRWNAHEGLVAALELFIEREVMGREIIVDSKATGPRKSLELTIPVSTFAAARLALAKARGDA